MNSLFVRFTNLEVASSSFWSKYFLIRHFSTRPRPRPSTYLFRPEKVEIVDDIADTLDSGETKYRRHQGVFTLPVQRVEKSVHKAIGRVLIDSGVPLATYKSQGKEMERHLQNRRLPVEQHDILKLRRDIENRLRESEAKKGRGPQLCETDEERIKYEENIKNKCEKRLRTSIYNWGPMKYDSPSKCITYCTTRFAAEYAALRRVFHEIAKREPTFKPKQMLDFGSGVGTAFFASEAIWIDSPVEEYLCVEASQEMNDLLDLLLRDGDKTGQPCHRNVTIRPFLPATVERQYDVVVSAYSLFELSSYEERIRTVANLWMKTNNFLILVERGTNAGFRAIVEARDYILAGGHEVHRHALSAMAKEHDLDLVEIEILLKRKDITEAEKFSLLREKHPGVDFPTLLPHGHVFAPCPHDMGCPRLMDVTPCNFSVRYFPLRLSGGEEIPATELFSFIVLRKGYAPASSDRWPRIVREPRKSKSCVWCQVCTPHGVLEDNPFHRGKAATDRGKQYRLANKSSWGDTLPMASVYEDDGTTDDEKAL